jgi:hypothetical protein
MGLGITVAALLLSFGGGVARSGEPPMRLAIVNAAAPERHSTMERHPTMEAGLPPGRKSVILRVPEHQVVTMDHRFAQSLLTSGLTADRTHRLVTVGEGTYRVRGSGVFSYYTTWMKVRVVK